MNSESVDLIYLDPPFNSNRDYASAPWAAKRRVQPSRTRGTLSDVDLAWIGILADKQEKVSIVIDAAGVAHGKSHENPISS